MIIGGTTEIFKVLEIRKASHLMTDVPFWTKQFSLLANANFEHVRGIQKVISNQSKYVETLKENGLQGKEEKRFYREIISLNDILGQQLDKLKTDANEYMNIERALRTFEDKFNSAVCKLDMKYKAAREKLIDQHKTVETQKREYHKLAFSIEKTEIKAKMSYQADVLYETKKKLDELQTKTTAQIDKYTKQLDKWETKMENLRKMSIDYEEAFQSREEERAKVILAGLQNSVDLTIAGNYAKRESGFSQINPKKFVRDRLVQRETVNVPTFQVYVGESNKDDMYETARAEVEAKQNGTSWTEAKFAVDEEDPTNLRDTNKKLSELNKATVFVVVKAYEKQQINQLHLKIGEQVTQLLPANDDGMAYGQVIHGLLHKKKKGFYPVSHVVQLQNETETKGDEAKKQKSKKRPKQDKGQAKSIIVDADRECIVERIVEMDNIKKTARGGRHEDGDEKGCGQTNRVESDARRRRRERKRANDVVVELL